MLRFTTILLAFLLAIPAWTARDFDGADSILNCGTMSDAIFTENGAITVSFWASFDSPGEAASGRIFTRGSFRLYTVTNDKIQLDILGSTALQRYTNINVFTDGVWTHWVLTGDGSSTAANWHIYKNGTEVSYATTVNGATPGDNSADSLFLGNHSTAIRTLDGRLAEFAAWNVILSANEIESLSKGGSPAAIRPANLKFYTPLWGVASPEPDLSGNGNNCTVTSAVLADHSPTGPYAGQSE